MSTPPLKDVTVVSLEQAVAAPFATRQLADLGARVIKIERPGSGDFARHYDETVAGNSSYFVWLNRSKESLSLDVKSQAGRVVLAQLLGRTDVVVHNLGPGAAERLGVDAASLSGTHPGVICCTISGWGTDGPWADRKAYDLLVQGEAGLLSVTGTPESMVKVGISVADIAAGMYAYSGILTALLQRSRTGQVSTVNVSLFEALAEWMGSPMYYTRYGGRQPERATAEHATITPYGLYRTADGTVLLAVQNEREWHRLCEVVLGDLDLATDPRFDSNTARVRNRGDLNELIGRRLACVPTSTAVELLDQAGVPNARVNQVTDLLEHPVIEARKRWRSVGVPGGEADALLPPADIGGTEPIMGPVPSLGEHTHRILTELGWSDQAIADLRRRGIV